MAVRKVSAERDDQTRRITEITRRDIFDFIFTEALPWSGRLDEVSFLERLYDLDALPSTDSRYRTAAGDIWQHRINNNDGEEDWVFGDPRFQLAHGPDEVLLGFLAQMVHPVVQSNQERAANVFAEFNRLLAPDGWMLKPHKQISGRPVYAPARIGTEASASIEFAHEVATHIDSEYLSQQVTRMEGAVDTDPELAIGTAKEFVKSICKTILEERAEAFDKSDDLLVLMRKVTKVLQLTPNDVAGTRKAASTIRRLLMNLGTIAQASAELRNIYGTGHGRSKSQASRVSPRHARLAVGTAATLGTFLFETHEERP